MQQIMNFSQQYLLVVLSQRLTIDVILSYIRHIFELPMSFLRQDELGKLFHDLLTPILLSTRLLQLFFLSF